MSKHNPREKRFISVISGDQKGIAATVTRGILAAAEPVYATGMLARNLLYSRRLLRAAHADRPVVSVGNLTTGGTGKTPIVIWLARQLRSAGRRPAVLLRGYKSSNGISDEQTLLRLSLKSHEGAVPVIANPNRFAGSRAVRAQSPDVDVFVLDDGLQHRKLARHFDLALVDATAPFGFDHVIPRGLLREPVRALRRVNAVVITRPSLVEPAALAQVEQRIRAEQAEVPLFFADFPLEELADSRDQPVPLLAIRGKSYFAFCGIGNPTSFLNQLQPLGGSRVGSTEFADHHPYTIDEIDTLARDASAAGAEMILTTEKDWVKIAAIYFEARRTVPPMIHRLRQSVQFRNNGGEQLLKLVLNAVQTGDEILGWRK